jgi:tRNA (guanine37-N1)-methyltransferase
MRIDILTLFPESLRAALSESVCARAQESGKVQLVVTDIRSFATDRHRTADDTPYGGGGGMVLLAEVVARAVEAVKSPGSINLVLDAAGTKYTQDMAKRLSLADHLVLVCGHYKGIDERALELLELEPVSIGDYVLTGGEPAAWVVADSVVRLIPGVLGDFGSAQGDSFFDDGLLGPAVYSRPAEWRGRAVPAELVSGDHRAVAQWRQQSAEERTRKRRPDLWQSTRVQDGLE